MTVLFGSGLLFGVLFVWAGLVRLKDSSGGGASALFWAAVGVLVGSTLVVYSSLALMNWLPRIMVFY
jgi:hypothetical protein